MVSNIAALIAKRASSIWKNSQNKRPGKIQTLGRLASLAQTPGHCPISVIYHKIRKKQVFQPSRSQNRKAAPRGTTFQLFQEELWLTNSGQLRALKDARLSSPRPLTVTTRPGSGPAATSMGIGLLSPVAQCAEASTSQA